MGNMITFSLITRFVRLREPITPHSEGTYVPEEPEAQGLTDCTRSTHGQLNCKEFT